MDKTKTIKYARRRAERFAAVIVRTYTAPTQRTTVRAGGWVK